MPGTITLQNPKGTSYCLSNIVLRKLAVCQAQDKLIYLYEQSKDVAKFISYKQTSPGEKSCKIDDITSSDNAGVRRAVILPIPLAEDHLTIVS